MTSKSSQIKKIILAEYPPKYQIKKQRIPKVTPEGDRVTITRVSLLTEVGTILKEQDGPDYETALRNLAYFQMIRTD